MRLGRFNVSHPSIIKETFTLSVEWKEEISDEVCRMASNHFLRTNTGVFLCTDLNALGIFRTDSPTQMHMCLGVLLKFSLFESPPPILESYITRFWFQDGTGAEGVAKDVTVVHRIMAIELLLLHCYFKKTSVTNITSFGVIAVLEMRYCCTA